MVNDDLKARFVDKSGAAAPEWEPLPPILIPKAEVEAEVARLAALPSPANGRRMAQITHPNGKVGTGLAPGITVNLCVLKPGEKTKPRRENASQVSFCIQGAGKSLVNGREFSFSQYDVINIPSWNVYEHSNDTNELQVRLNYSNAALLEKMNVYLVDENPPAPEAAVEELSGKGEGHRGSEHPFGTFQLTDDGAYLMPYETLVSPPPVEWKALHWPWKLVKQHLDKLAALGQEYRGRRLYLLYNPATGRTNGTSSNFFATITIRPPNIADRPHRHVSAAINYFFGGSGHSLVENKRYDWKAGDLMLTAPGWSRHCHISHEEPVYELTIQDSPLNIAMESLLWQEDLAHPAAVLGSQPGFATNRGRVAKQK